MKTLFSAIVILLFNNIAFAQTKVICEKTWQVKNLNVDRYRNGDKIPQVTDTKTWDKLTTGAWCWYDNDSTKYAAVYGKLYNWYAVNDPRGLAPKGWHIPDEDEWKSLIGCLGGESDAGDKLRAKGTTRWIDPNEGATNSSGFTALPGGRRGSSGYFDDIGENGYWWSASFMDIDRGSSFGLDETNTNTSMYAHPKSYGMSVRCIKD